MKKRLRIIAAALAICAAMTALAFLGMRKLVGTSLSDALYQQPSAVDGSIVIIGIDQKALDAYGPFSEWSREKVAEALRTLGSFPAAIGIDILYDGRSGNAVVDEALVRAAADCGNVAVACSGAFSSTFTEIDGVFSRNTFLLTAFTKPFDGLRTAAGLGHINAMADTDGILRHHLLYIDLPDGTRVPSLALAVAQTYRGGVALPPVNGHGFWYLPFSQRPGKFEMLSIADVLDGTVPADYFNGKLVLIGPAAPGLQDSYFTSVDHASQMYGVEYQANAIQALLTENYKREVSNALQLALLFLLLLASFAAFWQQKVRISTPIWLAACAGWVLLCKELYEAGWVLHVLWVPLGVTVIYIGSIAAGYLTAALERQRVTWTFQRYVAPEIVTELLSSGRDALKPGGRRRDIAVLFVDVRGFTSMSEKLEPERVVEILNKYLTLTTSCVMDNHGTLDKFVGDCTMAFWNAPFPQEDYVMLACKAAMAMVEGSRALSERLLQEYGCAVSFGVGVNVGPAVVGNIGAPQRLDYTAIGDTVNTAARLEANAPANTVYISRAVADALEGRIRATVLENPPKLKGKSEQFEILTLDELL